MRQVKEYVAKDGSHTYRVRYRSGERQHSETFRRYEDAETFSKLLDISLGEALRWLNERQTGVGDTMPFAEWFEVWRAHLTGITPRTRADYAAMHRRYLTELDHLPIAAITRSHVASVVNRLEGDGLSPKTIKNVIHMLSSVMGLAVDEGHVTRNPVRRVRLPKQQLNEHETRFLTKAEAAAIIDAAAEHYQPLVTFLFGTGLRWSEATALQARHIDLDKGTVRVQRAWKRVPGGWEIGPPKSRKANRTVNPAVDALVAVAPILRKPSDLVFTTTTGKPVQHSNFYNRIWVPACERAGLDPRPGIHATRHSFASWLLSEPNVGLEAVQDQLGHESYDTTRKVYAHLLPAVGVAAGLAASAAMREVLAQRANVSRVAIEASSSD